MAVNLTITLDANQPGPETAANGKIRERVKIVGATSVANDTGTYVTSFAQRELELIASSIAGSFSGQTLTATDLLGIGSSTVYGYVEGFA